MNKEVDKNDSAGYGAHTIDIAAPGKEIYSTYAGNKYGYATGTSMATRAVTGAVGTLMLTQRWRCF